MPAKNLAFFQKCEDLRTDVLFLEKIIYNLDTLPKTTYQKKYMRIRNQTKEGTAGCFLQRKDNQ